MMPITITANCGKTMVGILVVWKVRAKGCVAKCSAATVSGNVEL